MNDFNAIPTVAKEEKEEEFINSQEAFFEVFHLAQGQFLKIANALKDGKEIDELREINKGISYVDFNKYMRSEHKKEISGFYRDDLTCSGLIDDYNRVIEKLKEFNFHKKSNLKHELDMVGDLFRGQQFKKAS